MLHYLGKKDIRTGIPQVKKRFWMKCDLYFVTSEDIKLVLSTFNSQDYKDRNKIEMMKLRFKT